MSLTDDDSAERASLLAAFLRARGASGRLVEECGLREADAYAWSDATPLHPDYFSCGGGGGECGYVDRLADLVCGPDAYRSLPRLLAEAGSGQPALDVALSLEETYAEIAPVREGSDGVSAPSRCRSACREKSPVYSTRTPATSTRNMHAPSTCPAL